MKRLLFIAITLFAALLHGQDENICYCDKVYLDNIKTVQFHVQGLYLSHPIYDMVSGTPLTLSFDDLEGDSKRYSYSIVHCDRNWQPTNISAFDYRDGFDDEYIEDYQLSFNTITSYSNFNLQIPNRSLSWKISGNYLLKVYEYGSKKRLAITRRFMVVDPKVRITADMAFPGDPSKSRTHQEVDFIVDYQGLDFRSPQQEIKAVVMQNGRWDNAVTEIAPSMFRRAQLVFDYQDKITFPAGKEFRFLDMRSLRYRTENIAMIDRKSTPIEVMMYKDNKRAEEVHLQYEDTNGKFVIENRDLNGGDYNVNCDYANVLFTLYSPQPLFDTELFLFGAFSDWSLKPEFKLTYNDAVNGYVGKALIKQGYYDYAYAAVPTKGKTRIPDITETEGHSQSTRNDYTILLYYSPFGGRYDQLIGTVNFTSDLR